MKVRNKMYKPTDYKGHWFEAGAGGRNCPCMPCFRIHNCDYRVGNRWIDDFCCVTNRNNNGCPDELKRPNHIIQISGKTGAYYTKRLCAPLKKGHFSMPKIIRTCKRCGQRVNISEVDFTSYKSWKEKKCRLKKDKTVMAGCSLIKQEFLTNLSL